ncbi:MAG TPA: cofactor-independent phosphoglycerate mutase [Candidatus Binatia bacterium]|nr:cofactor-independent phosphoglycerate mutase [Candidatus Binatia bacterium]
MKYIILQGDGMADYPLDVLGGKTPLEAARTPNMDWLARHGVYGIAHVIPEGFPPGSDVGNMSIMGYDPAVYHTGRSPLEAASMGVSLGPDDIAFRCNLVTLGGAADETYMEDFTSGHISTEEAAIVIRDLARELAGDGIEFFPGVSYRHLMVWRGGKEKMMTTPPHDITDQKIAAYMPRGDGADRLLELMRQSQSILEGHPINQQRRAGEKRQANSIWLWGQGRAPQLPSLTKRFGIKGGVISAVDIIHGLGVYAGLERIDVPGITGFLDTNYVGKGEYGVRSLDKNDLVFIHVEATDEAGHMGDVEKKIQALEDFDEKVVGTVLQGMARRKDFRILLMPDHPTAIALKTHVAEPVPFVLYSAAAPQDNGDLGYNEKDALKTGIVAKKAYRLMEALIEGRATWTEI